MRRIVPRCWQRASTLATTSSFLVDSKRTTFHVLGGSKAFDPEAVAGGDAVEDVETKKVDRQVKSDYPKFTVEEFYASKGGRKEPPPNTPHEPSDKAVPEAQRMAPGRYRRVGHVFIVEVVDYPFKYEWEINHILRLLRLEFRFQTSIVPDEPRTRAMLFRVRHIVRINQVDTDELKKMLGIPSHVHFRDMLKTLPDGVWGGDAIQMTGDINYKYSLTAFTRFRKDRLKDILHRDALELKLLKEKKRLKAQQGGKEEQSAS